MADIPFFETQIAEVMDGKFMVMANDCLGAHLLRGERWETHLTKIIELLVHPGEMVADIGANLGYSTAVLARQVGAKGKVYSFEPQRLVYQQLCGNIFLNGLSNVFAFQTALGDKVDQFLEMRPIDYAAPLVNIAALAMGAGGESVRSTTLDSMAMPALHFLKVDAQGLEPSILRGAEMTVRKFRPLIFIEIEEGPLLKAGSSIAKLIEQIISMNYILARVKAPYPVDYLAFPTEHEHVRTTLMEQGFVSY